MKRIQFIFTPPSYGWIELHIAGYNQNCLVLCSAVADPFTGLFEWLEQIAGGADYAVWHVEEEGKSSRLIFLAGSTFLGDEQTYLLHCGSSGQCMDSFTAFPTRRTSLVRGMYNAFRAMAERAEYNPRHWEIHPRWDDVDLDDEDAFDAAIEDWPFTGARLSLMRSPKIDAYLWRARKPQQQFELALKLR